VEFIMDYKMHISKETTY